MTLKKLYKYWELTKEVKRLRVKLQNHRSAAEAPSSPNISGMPKGSRGNSKIEICVDKILTAEQELIKAQKKCLFEKRKLEAYISSISDTVVKDIFTYRFLKLMSWQAVAVKLGGNNTEDSVKKICYRYLQKGK